MLGSGVQPETTRVSGTLAGASVGRPGASVPWPTSTGGPPSKHAPVQVHTSHTTRQLVTPVSPQIAGSQHVSLDREHVQTPSSQTKSYVHVRVEPSAPLGSPGELEQAGSAERPAAIARGTRMERRTRMAARAVPPRRALGNGSRLSRSSKRTRRADEQAFRP